MVVGDELGVMVVEVLGGRWWRLNRWRWRRRSWAKRCARRWRGDVVVGGWVVVGGCWWWVVFVVVLVNLKGGGVVLSWSLVMVGGVVSVVWRGNCVSNCRRRSVGSRCCRSSDGICNCLRSVGRSVRGGGGCVCGVCDCRNVIVSSRGVEVGGVVLVVGCLDLDLVGVDGVVVGIVRCVGGMVVVVMGRAVALAASAAPSGTREVWSEVAGIQNRSAPRPHHLPLGTNGLALARRGEATLVAGVVSDASCLLSLALGLMRLLARVAFDVRALWAAGIVPDMGMAPRWPHQPALSAA